MNEWDTFENRREERGGLEEHLSAYYGPELLPQPLPPASWASLQSRLPHSRSLGSRKLRIARRRVKFPINPRRAAISTLPLFVQDAFERIAHEAHVSCTANMLSCTVKKQIQMPSARVSYWGKRKIHLLLPPNAFLSLEHAELNVLLASGLATYLLLFERRLPFGLVRMLIMWVSLLALLALVLLARQLSGEVVFPVAIILVAILLGTAVLSHRRGRALAFRGDELMVQWLGRSQVCEGLHALVRRSSHPRRRGFGRVSFDERIARVCGTRVAAGNEGLTLVR